MNSHLLKALEELQAKKEASAPEAAQTETSTGSSKQKAKEDIIRLLKAFQKPAR